MYNANLNIFDDMFKLKTEKLFKGLPEKFRNLALRPSKFTSNLIIDWAFYHHNTKSEIFKQL